MKTLMMTALAFVLLCNTCFAQGAVLMDMWGVPTTHTRAIDFDPYDTLIIYTVADVTNASGNDLVFRVGWRVTKPGGTVVTNRKTVLVKDGEREVWSTDPVYSEQHEYHDDDLYYDEIGTYEVEFRLEWRYPGSGTWNDAIFDDTVEVTVTNDPGSA